MGDMLYRLYFLLGCCLIVGCGSSKLYDVQTVVVLDGAPLAEADVTFLSVWGNTPSVTGVTNAAGEIAFVTNEEGEGGVLSGSYIVIVSKIVEENRLTNDEIRSLAAIGIQYRPAMVELIPEKYTRRETSDLRVSIGYWHSNELMLNLQSEKIAVQ